MCRDKVRFLRLAREAEGYYQLELYEEALQRAECLHSEGALEDIALPMKAECLRSLSRWEDGVAAYEAILQGDATNVCAYVGLGWCQKRANRLDLAKGTMERLLAARPDEPIGLFNLACYCALAGERERAFELLEQAIDKDEKYRGVAAEEEDFRSIRTDPTFRRLVGPS